MALPQLQWLRLFEIIKLIKFEIQLCKAQLMEVKTYNCQEMKSSKPFLLEYVTRGKVVLPKSNGQHLTK